MVDSKRYTSALVPALQPPPGISGAWRSPHFQRRPHTMSSDTVMIHHRDERPGTIHDLLRRLDFHAFSITLPATTTSRNAWNYNRVPNEWGVHPEQILWVDSRLLPQRSATSALTRINFPDSLLSFCGASTNASLTGCFPPSPTGRPPSTDPVYFL